TCLGLGTTAGCAFVADFSACASRGARKRRNRGGMVVRLHLHERVSHAVVVGIDLRTRLRPGMKAAYCTALHDGGVVGIRNYGALGLRLVRGTYHAKQRVGLGSSIYDPLGIEYLVAAVFAVRLRKH